MVQFIPCNLDLDQILKLSPPSNISNFCKDKMIYIISLVTAIPATNKDLEIKNGFVPIHSTFLKSKVKNYRAYLDYLLTQKIFQTNNQYIVGKCSKGYKFSALYHTTVQGVKIYNRTLIQKLKGQSIFSLNMKKKYNHLLKWYNEDLQIDYDLALSFIKEDLNRKLKNPALRDFDKVTKKFKDPQQQYNSALLNLERIRSGEFYLSVDANVFRLHSAISNFRSELRHCISYGGRKLLSLDIKNSQPYLSTVLLNYLVWLAYINNNLDNNNLLKVIIKDIKERLFNNNNTINSYVMLAQTAAMQPNSDLQRFITLVQQGKFYEYLEEQIGKELGIEYTDRKKVKESVFQVLFTDNRFLGQEDAKPKRIFKNLFPTVYELFCRIKKLDKTNLPRLLQRLESHLMLLVISKRIAKERPTLPIFTIHDSIVTTEGNELYVQKVMLEELEKAIGFAPKFSIEGWNPTLLKFKDGSDFYREERIAV